MADAVRQGVEVRVCFDVIVLTLHEVFEGGAQRDIRALAIADAHGRATEGLAEPVAEAVGQVTLHAARERALIQMSYATHSILGRTCAVQAVSLVCRSFCATRPI